VKSNVIVIDSFNGDIAPKFQVLAFAAKIEAGALLKNVQEYARVCNGFAVGVPDLCGFCAVALRYQISAGPALDVSARRL